MRARANFEKAMRGRLRMKDVKLEEVSGKREARGIDRHGCLPIFIQINEIQENTRRLKAEWRSGSVLGP